MTAKSLNFFGNRQPNKVEMRLYTNSENLMQKWGRGGREQLIFANVALNGKSWVPLGKIGKILETILYMTNYHVPFFRYK